MSERPRDDGGSAVEGPATERPPRSRAEEDRVPPYRILQRIRAARRNARTPTGGRLGAALRRYVRPVGDATAEDAPADRRDDALPAESRRRLRVERRPASGLSWDAYYLIVAVVGLLVPLVNWLLPRFLTSRGVNSALIGVFALMIASELYRFYSRIDLRPDPERSDE